MVRTLCLLAALIPVFFADAQSMFQHGYGGTAEDRGRAVCESSGGGFLVAGSIQSAGAGLTDIGLVRTDAGGDTLWTRTYGTAFQDDPCFAGETVDHGFFVSGTTRIAGMAATLLCKIDSTGNLQWARTYDLMNNDALSGVRITAGQGTILCGTATDSTWKDHAFLIRTDSLGAVVSCRTFSSNYGTTGRDVTGTNDGGFAMLARTAGTCLVVKTDAALDTMWTSKFSPQKNFMPASIDESADHGFFIAGTVDVGNGNPDWRVYLVRLDSTGTPLWSKAYGSTTSWGAYDVFGTADGGCLLTGTRQSARNMLMKIDPAGIPAWTKSYAGSTSSEGLEALATQDGGYAMAGWYWNLATGFLDLLLVKTDSLGNSACTTTTMTAIDTTVALALTPVSLVPAPRLTTGAAFSLLAGQVPQHQPLCTTGIPENGAQPSTLPAFPNPSSGAFTLGTPGTFTTVLRVTDVLGRPVLWRATAGRGPIRLDLTGSPEGLYILTAESEGRRTMVRLLKCGSEAR